MTPRTWLITGVGSGFGRELTEQVLERGERAVGTIRRPEAVADLASGYPDRFYPELGAVYFDALATPSDGSRREA